MSLELQRFLISALNVGVIEDGISDLIDVWTPKA